MPARLRVWGARIAGFFARGAPGFEFDEEVQAHLQLLTEQFIGQGMAPKDAAAAARRQFGNLTLLHEDRREMQSIQWLEALWRDVRHGARQLRQHPAFTIAAVLSLALGIGANAAVFTLLDQLLLRLLPVQQPERLVMIWPTAPHFGSSMGQRAVSYPLCQDFQSKAQALESVFCRSELPSSLTLDNTTERVNLELVSGNYFQALGVAPAVGRVFSPEADDRWYKGHPSVVLSHQYWLRRFGGDAGVVGRKVLLNNYPMEIVGVSAAGFTGLDPASSPDVRAPILMAPVMTPGRDDLGNRRSQWVQMFARLKPAYTAETARTSLQPLFREILQQEVDEAALRRISNYDRGRFLQRSVQVESAASGYSALRRQYSTALVVLMCMAGLILLITCSNVAGLLIARAAVRQKEMAVRLAIGAGRRVLIRQLLVESTLLSLVGAALGLSLSVVATRGLLSMLPASGATLMLRAEPDARILLFSIATAIATALLFGVVPALHATKLDLLVTLKDLVGVVTGGNATVRFRKVLVTAQVALACLLLMGAGLFVRTLGNLKNATTGFESARSLLSFQVDPAKIGYSALRTRNFYSQTLEQLRAVSGVKSAAYAMWPLLNGREWDLTVKVEGHDPAQGEDMQAYYNLVSPGFWQTLGIPLRQGRDFDDRDRVDHSDDPQPWTIAIVNREFAEHFFGSRDPIGRHIGCCHGTATKTTIRIVGVVENSLVGGPRSGVRRQVFLPYLESAAPAAVTFYILTPQPSAAIISGLRGSVVSLDPSLPVAEFKTLEHQLDETLSTERMIAWLSAVFGVLATLLAALGLYGVMAFVVMQRTREIGLRMALGAPGHLVLWLVMREVLMLLGGGLVIGIPGAWVLSRAVSSQLFGVAGVDWWTAGWAIAALGLVSVISGLIPAHRASAKDPTAALRWE